METLINVRLIVRPTAFPGIPLQLGSSLKAWSEANMHSPYLDTEEQEVFRVCSIAV